ncbi:FecR/PupR family sigma factor regulator [Neptunicella sp. SCSIO 80796]|uniref:FecR/PupR family sigma factor regulator n=1 Tax=Neptunicella plasticusilytica TaxID=3117012 RepID=UPI003A4D8345
MFLDEWVGYGIPESAVQEATQWLAKLDGGNMTPEEQLRFNHWLDDDPMHRWAFEELAEVWAKISTLNDQQHQIELPQVIPFPEMDRSESVSEQIDVKTTNQLAAFVSIGLILFGFLSVIIF